MSRKLPPWAQIAMHFAFLLVWGAEAQRLLPDGDIGKWIVLIAGSAQTALALYGIYSPPPSRGNGTIGPRADQQ